MQIMAGLFVGFGKPRNPILGMIVSGEVEETGANVTRFKKGDQVFGTTVLGGMNMNFGTYAEYKCLPERSYISHKPSNLNFLETAAIVTGVAWLCGVLIKLGSLVNLKKVLKALKYLCMVHLVQSERH
jgi:NADPH:quinone reductase-like Zn-dependent oxidoreductase